MDGSIGENRGAEYLCINPQGKVPALVDGELQVYEVWRRARSADRRPSVVVLTRWLDGWMASI